jgi:hypothetical protein
LLDTTLIYKTHKPSFQEVNRTYLGKKKRKKERKEKKKDVLQNVEEYFPNRHVSFAS